MFKNPFSFEGRIRRMEYGLSIIISAVVRVLLMFILIASNIDSAGIFFFLNIPIIIFNSILWIMAVISRRKHGNK